MEIIRMLKERKLSHSCHMSEQKHLVKRNTPREILLVWNRFRYAVKGSFRQKACNIASLSSVAAFSAVLRKFLFCRFRLHQHRYFLHKQAILCVTDYFHAAKGIHSRTRITPAQQSRGTASWWVRPPAGRFPLPFLYFRVLLRCSPSRTTVR